MTQRICSVDDCDGKHFGKGFCQKHYQRWMKHGDPLKGAAARNPETCRIEGCKKSPHSRGWCPMHYQRWRHDGTTDLVIKIPKPRPRRVGVEPCEIEGCDKPIQARGWCAAHWSRWKRHGSPVAQLPGDVVDGKRICPGCKQNVPLDDWYIPPSTGRPAKCKPCFAEWNRARAHMRRVGADGEFFTRSDVAARDGWDCGICGAAIDPFLPYPDPLSPSLDHVVPLSRGGRHVMENCQIAHLICNMRKHAKTPTKQAGGST